MIEKPIDQITKEDIESLITNSVTENRSIEFKMTLPGNTYDDKKEFCADVSSFANAAGGFIIFGIKAKDGIAKEIIGLGTVNEDEETLRLESIIRTSIDPRITEFHTKFIDGFKNGSVFVIQIPNSWNSPHMVTLKGTSRFFMRNSAGKHQMDVSEIRSAFSLSNEIPERMRQFRADRLAKIIADDTPVPIMPEPRIILHILPVSAFSIYVHLDINDIQLQYFRNLINEVNSHSRANFDGYLYSDMIKEEMKAYDYVQVYRSGIVESVTMYLFESAINEGIKKIWSVDFESRISKALQNNLQCLKTLGIKPPLFILLSLTGVKGYKMALENEHLIHVDTPIDKDILIIPEVLVESYDEEPYKIMKPIFDTVWNASGHAASPNYDEDGNYKRYIQT